MKIQEYKDGVLVNEYEVTTESELAARADGVVSRVWKKLKSIIWKAD